MHIRLGPMLPSSSTSRRRTSSFFTGSKSIGRSVCSHRSSQQAFELPSRSGNQFPFFLQFSSFLRFLLTRLDAARINENFPTRTQAIHNRNLLPLQTVLPLALDGNDQHRRTTADRGFRNTSTFLRHLRKITRKRPPDMRLLLYKGRTLCRRQLARVSLGALRYF